MMHLSVYNGLHSTNQSVFCPHGFSNNIDIVSLNGLEETASISLSKTVNEVFIPEANYRIDATTYQCKGYNISFNDTIFLPSTMVSLIF